MFRLGLLAEDWLDEGRHHRDLLLGKRRTLGRSRESSPSQVSPIEVSYREVGAG